MHRTYRAQRHHGSDRSVPCSLCWLCRGGLGSRGCNLVCSDSASLVQKIDALTDYLFGTYDSIGQMEDVLRILTSGPDSRVGITCRPAARHQDQSLVLKGSS